mmetsp:Transcript_39015/g.96426  ORF Transcript_39015/g.96426 Transcript_39015/m.96426 type:complete len:323 (+) Transcript_39015:535-1503(+)
MLVGATLRSLQTGSLQAAVEAEAQGAADADLYGELLLQEATRYNRLIGTVRAGLLELQAGLDGRELMSAQMEALALAISHNQVPTAWAEAGFPSLKPLSSWLRELEQRLAFVGGWLEHGRPAAFWLPGLLNPHALLTVALYYSSICAQLPLERLSFECQFGAPPRVLEAIRSSTGGGAWAPGFGAELAAGTASGDDDDASVLYVYGLFLEGARWDSARGCLAELEPRQMHAPLPVLGLRPVAGRRVPVAGIYVCPVYKTVSRVDAQTSSGHVIPNLVTSLELPTGDAPPTVGRGRPAQDALAHTIAPHWIRRGVAAFLSTPT